MSANDETPSSKPPLSLDDAERLASQFTPLWEDVPEESAAAQPASPPGNGEVAAPHEAAPASPQVETAPVSIPDDGPVASEQTPAMVAMAAPMGSSPDIDPNSTELPAHRSDYAPPRPLAPAQRTMVGLAPPPPVQVQVPVQVPQSATTTPLGLAAPKPARPSLELAEQSAIGLEPAKPRAPAEPRATQVAYADVSRASEPDLELPVRRKGATRVVVGIMSVAAVLVGAGAIRTVFFKGDDATRASHTSVDAPRAPSPPPMQAAKATAQPTTEPAPVEQKTATTLPSPSTTEPEPANTAAPASSAEPPSSPAATESAAPAAPPASGLRLAATRTSSESTQTKAVDASKARTAQRVEEAKHVQHPVRTPVAPRRPHTEAASHPPASPQIPGGGSIVRQSPF